MYNQLSEELKFLSQGVTAQVLFCFFSYSVSPLTFVFFLSFFSCQ